MRIGLTSVVLASAMSFSNIVASAQPAHHNHAKHNMIVIGENDVFASHLVYKQPHNYQVILSVHLPNDVKTKYLAERRLHPNDTYLYLLEEMDMRDISTAKEIRGSLFREDANGEKSVIDSALTLQTGGFRVVYFSELPLSLERKQH